MARWLAIANPQAGALRSVRFRDAWMPRISECVAQVVYTEAPGDACAIARAAKDYDGIAVVGGDGTLFEVLAGLEPGGPTVAVVPAGRGNCLALDLNVGSVPLALRAIVEGVAIDADLMAIDVEFADGRRSRFRAASTLAVGYVADTVAHAARFSRLGRYAYAAAAICTRPRRMLVESSCEPRSRRPRTMSGIVVNNTRFLANFLAFPDASVADGLLNVLELDVGWPRQMLHNASVLSRGYFYNPGRELQCPELRIRLPRAACLMVDGELISDVTGLEVRCERAAARFIRGHAA